MARKKKPGSSKAKKARIDLFGPPPLFFGESEATYNKLFERVNEALKPTDIFEEFAARDITNAMMDSMRFARLKPELLNANMHKGLERVLEPLCNISVQCKAGKMPFSADQMAAGWASGVQSWIDEVDERMNGAELSMEAVIAETLSYEMNGFEGIDRLATNAEARRHAILREIWRRREAEREASPPAARISHMAAIEKEKANDNEKPAVEGTEVVEVEPEQIGADESTAANKRRSKAAGE